MILPGSTHQLPWMVGEKNQILNEFPTRRSIFYIYVFDTFHLVQFPQYLLCSQLYPAFSPTGWCASNPGFPVQTKTRAGRTCKNIRCGLCMMYVTVFDCMCHCFEYVATRLNSTIWMLGDNPINTDHFRSVLFLQGPSNKVGTAATYPCQMYSNVKVSDSPPLHSICASSTSQLVYSLRSSTQKYEVCWILTWQDSNAPSQGLSSLSVAIPRAPALPNNDRM